MTFPRFQHELWIVLPGLKARAFVAGIRYLPQNPRWVERASEQEENMNKGNMEAMDQSKISITEKSERGKDYILQERYVRSIAEETDCWQYQPRWEKAGSPPPPTEMGGQTLRQEPPLVCL